MNSAKCEDEDVSSSEDSTQRGERLEPIGESASQDDDVSINSEEVTIESVQRKLKSTQEEQEVLNSALFALTTHFAQVQLRLGQILESPTEDRDVMLRSLEDFASHGLPDIKLIREKKDETGLAENVRNCRKLQKTYLIAIKESIKQLEEYATEFDKREISQEVVALKSKLNQEYARLVQMKQDKKTFQIISKRVNIFIEQLKTQISDLENYIDLLKSREKQRLHVDKIQRNNTNLLVNSLREFLYILEMFAGVQVRFVKGKKQSLFVANSQQHWGNLRAALEVAIAELRRMIRDDSCNVIRAIRKNLAVKLLALMSHGVKARSNRLLCFDNATCDAFHPWEILWKYYEIHSNKSPTVKKLSQSFNLKLREMNSNEDILLSAIEEVSFEDESYDRKFKSFACKALSLGKLSKCLQLLYESPRIINTFYLGWSYAKQTGFKDAIESLKQLDGCTFDFCYGRKMDTMEEAFIS